MHNLAPSRAKGDEAGAILFIALLVLLTVCLFAAFLIFHAYRNVIRAELQTAADAAALAGAGNICSSVNCLWASVYSAFDTLNSQVVHGNLDKIPRLNIAEMADSTGFMTWQTSDYRAQLRRGIWNVNTRTFQSVDDVAWVAANPGLPPALVYNAIEVTLTRLSVLPPFLSGYTVPVCHLEARDLPDGWGQYHPAEAVRVPRFFTASDRYCGVDLSGVPLNCGVRPAMSIEPKSCNSHSLWMTTLPPTEPHGWGEGILAPLNCYASSSDGTLVGAPGPEPNIIPYEQEACWNTPRFTQVSDSFGVIGMPFGTGALAEVQAVLGAADGCTATKIGDPFTIVSDGFNGAGLAVEDLVWNQITGVYGSALTHPAYSAVPELAGLEENFYYEPFSPPPASIPTNPSSSGICNSRRFTESLTAASPPYVNRINQIISTSAWIANVPVIAAPSQSCSAAMWVNDPVINPGSSWVVVGFVRMAFYDVDIGRNPPNWATHSAESFWTRGGGLGPMSDPSTTPCAAKVPYSFMNGAKQCNLVAGKIQWDSELIPLSPKGIVPERHAALVN
jgi:hypothetical protein